MLLALFDRIPDEGDEVSAVSEDGVVASFEVEKMDNLRVDKVRVRIAKNCQKIEEV